MKKTRKLLSLTLVILWILSCPATAETRSIRAQQGEEIDIPVYISANPNNAVFAILKLEYDHNAFEVIPGFVQKDTASILNLNGIPEGEAGNAQFRVLENTENGTYQISIIVESAYNIDESPVTGLESDIINLHIGKKQKENQYYPNGKLKKEYKYDSNGYLRTVNDYNRYGYITRVEESTAWDSNGNVLQTEEHFTNSFGKYAINYNIYTYDSHGNRTSTKYTYADGSPGENFWTYQYDNQDNRILSVTYNKDGSIDSYDTDYIYDEKNRLMGYTTYDANNVIISRNTDYKRDNDGHVLSYSVLDANKNIKEYNQQIWENGIRKEYITTNSKGKEISHYIYDIYEDYLSTYFIDEQDTWAQIYTGKYEYGEDCYTYRSLCTKLDGTRVYEALSTYNIKDIIVQYKSFNENGTASCIEEYDDKGQPIRYLTLDENGNIKYTNTYEYNSNGDQIKSLCFYADGSYFYGQSYEYDKDGHKIKSCSLTESGDVESYHIYEYYSDGNEYKDSYYNSKGELQSYVISEYDSKNRKTGYISYYANGKKSYEAKYRYLEDGTYQKKTLYYNSDGILTEESDWK